MCVCVCVRATGVRLAFLNREMPFFNLLKMLWQECHRQTSKMVYVNKKAKKSQTISKILTSLQYDEYQQLH